MTNKLKEIANTITYKEYMKLKDSLNISGVVSIMYDNVDVDMVDIKKIENFIKKSLDIK